MSAGKGEEGRTWSCCAVKQTAVIPQTHRQCQVVEVWEEGGVWQHQSLVTQRVGGGGGVVCREEGEERHENGLHPGHIPLTYIRY